MIFVTFLSCAFFSCTPTSLSDVSNNQSTDCCNGDGEIPPPPPPPPPGDDD